MENSPKLNGLNENSDNEKVSKQIFRFSIAFGVMN